MLDDYVEFFMDLNTAECYCKLKEELDKLLQKKVILLQSFFVYCSAKGVVYVADNDILIV